MDIKRLVKKNVRKLTAYEAKEIACRVKLDANESPCGFDGSLQSVRGIKTHRYPDPEAKALRAVLAKEWGVNARNVLHGNGSDELIYYLINTFGGPVLFPTPTFSMYGIIAEIVNERPVGVPLKKDFGLDLAKMVRTMRREKPRLTFMSSPNNPTGNCFDRGDMMEILKTGTGIVVIDEAYQPFSRQKSFTSMTRRYGNLVVMKTLSKIGLAALRTGFIVARRDIIDEVNKTRLPFNVNALSQAVATDAVKKKNEMDRVIHSIIEERDGLLGKMEGLDGVKPFPSEANFILFRVTDADGVYSRLLKRGVLVRNLSGVVKGCLRVTIGSPAENRAFLRALKKSL